jgi:hypothetical protein
MGKIKIDFFDLFGVGGAGWRCRSLKKKQHSFKKTKKHLYPFFFFTFFIA